MPVRAEIIALAKTGMVTDTDAEIPLFSVTLLLTEAQLIAANAGDFPILGERLTLLEVR